MRHLDQLPPLEPNSVVRLPDGALARFMGLREGLAEVQVDGGEVRLVPPPTCEVVAGSRELAEHFIVHHRPKQAVHVRRERGKHVASIMGPGNARLDSAPGSSHAEAVGHAVIERELLAVGQVDG